MLKKPITFVDYNGVERTEDFYFNMTEAELTMMQMSTVGGMQNYLDKIVKAQDAPAIMNTFRSVIHQAYGVKSDDGRRFIKSEEISSEFEQTEAYSILFMELCTDANAAAAFVNGIMPPSVTAKAAAPQIAIAGV